ncbi:hypothetical protein CBS147347_6678 [Aspergillus niger]|nr:hypothetical protein CBS147347_6678 [Aspergillus niger]
MAVQVEYLGIYDFVPSEAAAIVFAILFLITTILHYYQAFRWRVWFFIPFLIGCAFEVIGYIARAKSSTQYPDYDIGPELIQYILILVAPALLAASIYMEFGRLMIMVEGEQYSIIRRAWLTKIFVLGDVISFFAQFISAAMLAKTTTASKGQTIMKLGVLVQIVFFGLFLVTIIIFHKRLTKYKSRAYGLVPWRKHLLALYATGLLIFVRSIFRGCQCKKRHIKCDEGLPACKFCDDRRIECHYACRPPGPSSAIPEHSNDKISPVPSALPLSPLSASNRVSAATNGPQIDTRLLEATLLHHYYTNTHSTLVEDENSRLDWQVNLTKVASTQSFALDSLLAFTALHLAYLEPNRRQAWTLVAFNYSDKACSMLSQVIGRLSAATADAAIVCSIYIVLFAIAQYRLCRPSTSYLDEVLRIAKLIRGCVLLSPKSNLFSRFSEKGTDHERAPLHNSSQDVVNQKQRRASKIYSLASQVLSQIQHPATNIPSHHHAAYTVSIQYILEKFDASKCPHGRPDMGAILLWPLFFPETFVTLLQERDLIARVIFLLYPLTLHFLKDTWFVGDLGERLGSELISPEEHIPPEWGEILGTMRREFGEGSSFLH